MRQARGSVRTHKAPVSVLEVLGHGVEGNVASRALGVVVWGRQLGAGGVEATAGNHGGGSGNGTSEHLRECSN